MKRRNWFPWTCGVLLLVGLPLQMAVLPGLVDALTTGPFGLYSAQ